MRKTLGGIVLLLGIVLTPIVVHSSSISFPHFLKSSSDIPSGVVADIQTGTIVQKGNSTVKIPPDTVSSSPTSPLHGSVTQLKNSPVQSSAFTPSINTPQNTSVPIHGWDTDTRGNYFGSFTGATDSNLVYSYCSFSSSRSYDLKVDMYVTGETSSTTQYEVCLYDDIMSDGLVYSNVLPVGQSVTVTYPHLNPTHVYYLRWRTVGNNQSFDGKYIVHF